VVPTAPQRGLVLLGESPGIQTLHIEIDCAARSAAKVLLTGETGVGKEVVARLIHARSARSSKPFVTINCAGVPDSLLESELFGHARGSFTDAYRDNPGRLRAAQFGTVFLDEVGEMSLRMQAMLLRFLETGEVETIGGTGPRTQLDVRVIAATNRNMAEAVAAGDFRQDLYYRLNVLHLEIPPLRERASDVEQLVRHFLGAQSAEHRRPVSAITAPALGLLVQYSWPGNVRELRNVVERLVMRTESDTIDVADLDPVLPSLAHQEKPSALSRHSAIEDIRRRMFVDKESFWVVAYAPFMSRDITRTDLRYLLHTGLEQTHGSYRLLVELFNMPVADYKRFLSFLKQHDCHLPFQQFRTV
jgi:transcriptional regulator with PAS, ATPase and Fis domain